MTSKDLQHLALQVADEGFDDRGSHACPGVVETSGGVDGRGAITDSRRSTRRDPRTRRFDVSGCGVPSADCDERGT